MAKKAPLNPPTPETLDEMLRLIGNNPGPVSARFLVTSLAGIQKLTENQVTAVLNSYVDQGTLYKTPATGKGKDRFWNRDFAKLATDEVLRVVQGSSHPISARDVSIQIVSPKLTEAETTEVLSRAVTERQLFVSPGKSATAKPNYWHQDLNEWIRISVLEAMKISEVPLTAKDLITRLKLTGLISEIALIAMLEALTGQTQLHLFPATTAKGKPRYWNRDPIEFGCRRMLDVVGQKGPQTLTALKKELKGLSESQIHQVVGQLQTTERLFPHPIGGTVKQLTFGLRPPAAAPYLEEMASRISKVVALLTTARVPMDELRRAAVQMLESAGIVFGAQATATTATPSPVETGPSPIDLIELMKRIDPAAERGALVSARDLRRMASLPKMEFDQTVLSLARQGRLSLHQHDFASSLIQEERDDLVTDGQGKFYIALALSTD